MHRRRPRALALAGIAVAGLAPAVALAVPRGEDPRLARAALPVKSAHAVSDAVAERARRAEAARPHFPVRGEFNWGQYAAAFGGGRGHEGQDVFGRTGTPLVAVRNAVVVARGNDGGRGNYVALFDERERWTYVYLHLLHPPVVRKGERVAGGQRVGALGCTGSCSGDHLHFELRSGRGLYGPASDPRPLLERWARADGVPATLPPGTS